MGKKNYYDILGVSKNASEKEIKEAYRKAALKYHPDKHSSNPLAHLAEEKFKEINEAYGILVDSTRRREYDSSHEGVGEKEKTRQQQNSSKPQSETKNEHGPKSYHDAKNGKTKKVTSSILDWFFWILAALWVIAYVYSDH